MWAANEEFEEFFREVEPRLRRGFLSGASDGVDRAGDAVGEALGWAWENWERLQTMENRAGYLYTEWASPARGPGSGSVSLRWRLSRFLRSSPALFRR